MGESLPIRTIGDVFAHAPDATLLVDSSGVIAAANPQVEPIFGYRPQELAGQHVELLVPPRLRALHEAHRAQYAQRPAPRPMGARLNLMAVRADGREFPVEIALCPLQAAEGWFVAASVRDVAERVSAEALVRRSEERFRLLAERASDMIYIRRTGPDGSRPFEYVSPASYRLFGYSPEDFYENPGLTDELLHPDDILARDRWRVGMDRAATSPPLRYRRRDGSWVWVEFHVSEFEGAAGDGPRYEGLARDVTSRIEAESTERWLAINSQLQDERERIAHDLHDGALGGLYGLGLELRAVARDLAQLSPDATARANAAADELAGISHEIRAYVMGLRPGGITRDLAGSVAELCEQFEASSGISTRVVTDELPHDLRPDAAVATFHVVQEALNNVRKHADATVVEVGLSYGGGVLSARVQDNGRGFDVDARPLVSSIGMRSMAHRAHSLGGALKVASTPSEGTTVELEIPLD